MKKQSLKYVICDQTQHGVLFTKGRVYRVRRGAFGHAVISDRGSFEFIGHALCYTSSRYMMTFVTTFKKATVIDRLKHWISPVPVKPISLNHRQQLARRLRKSGFFPHP